MPRAWYEALAESDKEADEMEFQAKSQQKEARFMARHGITD